MRYVGYLLVIALAISIFYFSWVPKPDIGSAPYFPKEIGRWVNNYGNLRTAVPFFILGGVFELFFVRDIDKNKKRIMVLASLFLIVVIAESGQLFLANRHFDLWDIFWGTVGALAGVWVGISLKKLKNLSY